MYVQFAGKNLALQKEAGKDGKKKKDGKSKSQIQ